MTWRRGWVCQECTFANENPSEPICEVCSEPVPGTFGCRNTTPASNKRQKPAPTTKSSASSLAPTKLYENTSQKPESNNIEVICLEDSDHDDAPQPQNQNTKPNDFLNSITNHNGHVDRSSSGVFGDTSCQIIELSDDDGDAAVAPTREPMVATAPASLPANNSDHKKSANPRKRSAPSSGEKENNKRKAAKTALNKSRKLGAYFWSEIIVHIPEAVWNKYGPFVKESMDLLHGDVNIFSVCDRKNWITWERKRIVDDLEPECFDKPNQRLILNDSCPVSREIAGFSALFYEPNDFITEYESGQILARIRAALQSPNARVALVVFDLRRTVRLRANQAMRKQLSQASAGGSDQTVSAGFSSVGEIDEFAAYLINQFGCRCSFLNFATLGDVGMFLSQTTRHIAQEPYKPDATSSLGFRHQNVMKSAVVGGIFTPAMKEWFNVLIRIPGISPKRAEGIIKRYPSCASLLFAYGNCRSNEERKQMLKEVVVEEKRLGPSVSATVFDYLYSS